MNFNTIADLKMRFADPATGRAVQCLLDAASAEKGCALKRVQDAYAALHAACLDGALPAALITLVVEPGSVRVFVTRVATDADGELARFLEPYTHPEALAAAEACMHAHQCELVPDAVFLAAAETLGVAAAEADVHAFCAQHGDAAGFDFAAMVGTPEYRALNESRRCVFMFFDLVRVAILLGATNVAAARGFVPADRLRAFLSETLVLSQHKPGAVAGLDAHAAFWAQME